MGADTRKGYCLACVATVSWAVASILTKELTGKLPPFSLYAIELTAGTFALWVWVLVAHPFRLAPLTLCRLAFPGVLQPGLAYALTFVSLQWTTISNETLIWSSESVMMLFFARIFLGRKIRRSLVVLSIAAFFGVALSSIPRGSTIFANRTLLANAMILVAVMAACAYTLLAERSLAELEEEQLFALHQTAGLVVAAPFAIVEVAGRGGIALAIPWLAWGTAILAGLLLFAIPFVLYLRAIHLLGSATASQFLPLVPILTALMAALVLEERLGAIQYAGIVVVIASVVSIGVVQSHPANQNPAGSVA